MFNLYSKPISAFLPLCNRFQRFSAGLPSCPDPCCSAVWLHVFFWLLKILSLILRPKISLLDGTDNTITINSHLHRLLTYLGIEQRNNIYLFRDPKTQRYCFTIYPKDQDASLTITRELQYNSYYDTFGFDHPSIQEILYHWSLPHDTKLTNIPITLHISHASIIYFRIDHE